MKAVIQRVTNASVTVNGKVCGEINNGFLVLLGVAAGDTEAEAELLAQKTANLRIFCDEEDKMNLSLLDTNNAALVISQFTLCANTKKGNRPSFIGTAKEPNEANRLYEYYCECLKNNGVRRIEKGVFGEDMKVRLLNDGPVTVILDTDVWRKD